MGSSFAKKVDFTPRNTDLPLYIPMRKGSEKFKVQKKKNNKNNNLEILWKDTNTKVAQTSDCIIFQKMISLSLWVPEYHMDLLLEHWTIVMHLLNMSLFEPFNIYQEGLLFIINYLEKYSILFYYCIIY